MYVGFGYGKAMFILIIRLIKKYFQILQVVVFPSLDVRSRAGIPVSQWASYCRVQKETGSQVIFSWNKEARVDSGYIGSGKWLY